MAEVLNSTYSIIRYDIRRLKISATGERPCSLSVCYARTVEFYASRFDREGLCEAERIVLSLVLKEIDVERLVVRARGVLDGYLVMCLLPPESASWHLCKMLFPQRVMSELWLPTGEHIVRKTLHRIASREVVTPDGEDALVSLVAQVAWQECGERVLAFVRPMWTPTLEAELDRLAHIALDAMTERQRFVVRRRCGFEGSPMTLEQICRKMGISRERVRQIEVKALQATRASDCGRDLHRMMRTLVGQLEDAQAEIVTLKKKNEHLASFPR